MLIDQYLPEYDFSETHRIDISGRPDDIDRAIHTLNLGDSIVVRLLFALRGMPGAALTMTGLERMGFQLLAHRPGDERVLGLIGRFWTIRGGLECFAPARFTEFNEPGFAKAVWNFRMTPLSDGGTQLATETRVLCTDVASRRRFRRYWRVIRPFSGWIRMEVLRAIKRNVERTVATADRSK